MDTQERASARKKTMEHFNESGAAGAGSQIFGLPFSEEESEIILIPVPWEPTVSSRAGTAHGPEAIRAASAQVALYDLSLPDAWKYGFAMQEMDKFIEWLNRTACMDAHQLKLFRDAKYSTTARPCEQLLQQINKDGDTLNKRIFRKASHFLDQQKILGIVGGDHSAPLGLMQALADHYESYGILHIDAHFDHLNAYEGFEFSHASIMRNASCIPQIKKFVHVGIRSYCKEEVEYIAQGGRRFVTYFDRGLHDAMQNQHQSWTSLCARMVHKLPDNVYISFDIDGLKREYCPHTGTPEPGGLEYNDAIDLLHSLLTHKKRIIGFDLSEVAPDPACPQEKWEGEWNATVGSRILYQLCSLAAISSFGQWKEK